MHREDREAISWAATAVGHSGDVVRDVMLAAVEQRFGTAQAAQPIEWLSDNGSAGPSCCISQTRQRWAYTRTREALRRVT
jgi:transposase InsO family protein